MCPQIAGCKEGAARSGDRPASVDRGQGSVTDVEHLGGVELEPLQRDLQPTRVWLEAADVCVLRAEHVVEVIGDAERCQLGVRGIVREHCQPEAPRPQQIQRLGEVGLGAARQQHKWGNVHPPRHTACNFGDFDARAS